jgi:hypothetical protein
MYRSGRSWDTPQTIDPILTPYNTRLAGIVGMLFRPSTLLEHLRSHVDPDAPAELCKSHDNDACNIWDCGVMR